jgi:hypothetical protein
VQKPNALLIILPQASLIGSRRTSAAAILSPAKIYDDDDAVSQPQKVSIVVIAQNGDRPVSIHSRLLIGRNSAGIPPTELHYVLPAFLPPFSYSSPSQLSIFLTPEPSPSLRSLASITTTHLLRPSQHLFDLLERAVSSLHRHINTQHPRFVDACPDPQPWKVSSFHPKITTDRLAHPYLQA